MKLRILNDDAEADPAHEGAAVGVGWLNGDTAVSVGDDKRLLQWSTGAAGQAPRSQHIPGYKRCVMISSLLQLPI